MNKKTSLKIVLLILILIFLILIIQSTYSKYVSSKKTDSSLFLSTWNININNIQISKNKNFTKNVKLILDKNPNIKENKIAPGATGHFEVILDSTGTTLPFDYSIALNPDSTIINNVPDFKITSYSENDGPVTPIDDLNLQGHMDPALDATGNVDINKKNTKKFLFNVEWLDTPADKTILNNIDDVKASKIQDSQGVIPLIISLVQTKPNNIP